jgi:N-formylmaleamate deformylase
MSEWSDGYLAANDLKIHYYRTGDREKPPLLFLHGVVDSGRCWTRVADRFADRYDLVMIDARGHGRTEGPLPSLSYQLLAADAAAAIRGLELAPAYLYGHSMGAMTAAVVAARYPDLVRGVVLEDPPWFDPAELAELQQTRSAEDGKLMWRKFLALRTLSPAEAQQQAREMNPGWDEAEIGPWLESKLEFNPAVVEYIAARPDADWQDVVSRITCPLLLITGDPTHHPIITPRAAQLAQQLWQNGELAQIAGAGHSIHRDRFEETMMAVENFLGRH